MTKYPRIMKRSTNTCFLSACALKDSKTLQLSDFKTVQLLFRPVTQHPSPITSSSRGHAGTWALGHLTVLLALLLSFACSRTPLVPASGEFVFENTWGKDGYTVSDYIGPGHGDGTAGSEIGAFNTPTVLAVYQSELYVLDSGNQRVQKFSLSGAPRSFSVQTNPAVNLNCLGSSGYMPGEFVDPSDLCMSPAGNLFVADSQNFCVQVFDQSGRLVKLLGRILSSRPAATNVTGGFIMPVAVTTDPAGNAYVLDPAKSTIDKFSNSLNIDPAWQTAGGLHDSAFASAVDLGWHAASLYVLFRTKIMEFSAAGGFTKEIEFAGFGQDRLANASRLSILDEMFVVSDGNYLKFFTLEGRFLYSIGGLTGDRDAEFRFPRGAVLVGDELYIADSGNNRLQIFKRR